MRFVGNVHRSRRRDTALAGRVGVHSPEAKAVYTSISWPSAAVTSEIANQFGRRGRLRPEGVTKKLTK